jgi:hypothetical protein
MLLAATAGAQQVGYPPATSPYLDLPNTQELSLIYGNYHAHRDPADVGPEPGSLVGLHYEWLAGGPAYLVGDISRMSSDRNLIDPLRVGPSRNLGTVSRPLYSASFDLALGLTGGKTWHHLAPQVSGGLGFVSDLRTSADSGGFEFGTRFALNMGAGVRWIVSRRWAVRADITDRLYTLNYPEDFYTTPTGGTALIPSTQAKSFWTSNPAFTLGLGWLF